MAIHSSILAWKIPWTEETGGLQSMGSQKKKKKKIPLKLHFCPLEELLNLLVFHLRSPGP